MLLSLQPLDQVSDVNTWRRVHAWEFNQGDAPTLYFQLVDAGRDTSSDGFSPWQGRRYVPASGSMLWLVVHNVNDAFKLYKVARQPFPLQDPSIWSVTIQPGDFQAQTAGVPPMNAIVPSSPMSGGNPDVLLTLAENSTPGLAAVTGSLTVTAATYSITLTASGGATFATPPAAGTQLVIGVDSALYAAASALGGYYTVTGTSTSTVVTATKTSDLFYAGLTAPVSIVTTAVASTGDVRVGAPVKTTSGFIQGRMRVGTQGQYGVSYRSPYTDNSNTNQTGWGG